MISEKKRLQIANICYANVSGLFAMFCNPKFRGPNFSWEWFVEHCAEHSEDWMFINGVRGHKPMVNETAKQYASEIANRLVGHLTE